MRPNIDRLVDRLSARLGARRVRRLIAQDSHIPEIAAASRAGADLRPQMPAGRRSAVTARRADLAPRPLRLLTRPEPIEAVAEVPDGPPLRFSWRRALHEVIAAEGPERIEGAWWSEHGGPANLRGLFPRRGQNRPALLAVPRRALPRSCARRRRADLVPAWDVCVRSRMSNALSRIRLRLEFLLPARRVAPGRADGAGGHLGLAGFGLCDRNSVAGVVRAHLAKREQNLALKYHPGARLVFADGTPDILAYPRDRAGWGRLTRLLTLGNLRAEKGECILHLDDLLAHVFGLELIAMGGDARLLSTLARRRPGRVRLAASMLYRGRDRARLGAPQTTRRAKRKCR